MAIEQSISEEWRPISGLPHHEISSHGRARSVYGTRVRILPGTVDKKGYRKFNLPGNSNTYSHVATLTAFAGPRPLGLQCAHLDGDPGNNHISNLAWVTPSENNHHKSLHGTAVIGERNNRTRLSVDKVRDIKARLASGHAVKAIRCDYGVDDSTIRQILKGETWRHVQ